MSRLGEIRATPPAPKIRIKLLFRMSALLVRVAMFPVARIDIEDARIEPQAGTGVIIAANHRSMLDFFVGILAYATWGVTPHVFMRGDLLTIPLAGRLLRSAGALPGGSAYGAASVRAAREVLRQGEILAMTPEGRIPPEDQRPDGLAEFKNGIGYFVSRFGSPILLCAMVGTDLAWPRGRRLPRLHLIPSRRPTILVRVSWLPIERGTSREDTITAARAGLHGLLMSTERQIGQL